jgi:hypothetical protein
MSSSRSQVGKLTNSFQCEDSKNCVPNGASIDRLVCIFYCLGLKVLPQDHGQNNEGNFEILELGWSVWSRHNLRSLINGLAIWTWEFKMKFEVKREILKHDALKTSKCQWRHWPFVGVGENVSTLTLGWRSRLMYMV